MRIPRRHALLGAATMIATPAHAQSTPESRAAGWLQAWDSQGPHRTATEGDQKGADWLLAEARAIHPAATTESFPLDRIDPVAAYVEIDGERIRGEMLYDAPDTLPGGIHGLAAGPDQAGNIAVLELPPTAVYSPAFANLRRESPHRVLIVITQGGAPGLAVFNAEAFLTPFGPAVLQLPSTAKDAVFAAASRGASLRAVVRSRRTKAEARNVVLTIPGRDRSRPPTVVMTPRSSWFESTSERGGGLVCWLETLRALAANPPAGDVVFTANSGHELGHIGLDAFLARRPGWEKAATWIHYGANIGAAGGHLSIQSASDDLRALAAPLAAAMADKATIPNGETRDIHKAGGRYLTLVGSNPLFHLAQDRWPHAVDVPAIARIAATIAAQVVALTR